MHTPNGPVQLRFRTDNTLAVVRAAESNVLAEIPLHWAPETVYRVGLSRTAERMAVSVNGYSVEVDHSDIALMTGWRMLRADDLTTGGWEGHVQKVVLWDAGVQASELRGLVERWV